MQLRWIALARLFLYSNPPRDSQGCRLFCLRTWGSSDVVRTSCTCGTFLWNLWEKLCRKCMLLARLSQKPQHCWILSKEAMKTNEAMEEHVWHICRLEKYVKLFWKFCTAEACPGLLKSWWNVSQNLVLTTTKPMLKIWIDLQKAMPYWQTMIQPTSSMQWKEMDLLLRCWKVSNLLLSSPPSVVLRCSFKAKSAAINTQQLSQMYKHNQTYNSITYITIYTNIWKPCFQFQHICFFSRGRHRSYSVSFAAVPALSQRKIGRRGNHGQAHQEQSRGRSSMVFSWSHSILPEIFFCPTSATFWGSGQPQLHEVRHSKQNNDLWWSTLIYHESWSMTSSFNQIVSVCLETDQCRPHPLKSWMQQISWRCKAMVGPIKMANQAGSVVILEWSWKTFALCLVTSKLCLQVHAFSMVYRWSLLLLSSFARSVATDGI